MRTLTLYLRERFFDNLFIGRTFFRKVFLLGTIFILAFLFPKTMQAQWVSDPAVNTKIVLNASNPIDISSVSDSKGGAFVFWQDTKGNSKPDIFFMHFDANGKVSFRADGKMVTEKAGEKTGPVSAANLSNSAVVIWKDFSSSKNGNLFAQRVFNNGNLLWSKSGVQITSSNNSISDYSVASGADGEVFVSFIAKEPEITGNFKVLLNKISPDGKLLTGKDSILVSKSRERKSTTNVLVDNNGGAYIFWLEFQNAKIALLGQHIDSTEGLNWGKKPLIISGSQQNVISYSATLTKSGSVYLAWQIQKSEKDIYHQLINPKGKMLWGDGGKIATKQKGSQINPQSVAADSSIILSWTNDIRNDKNIFVQKYNRTGKALWNEIGIPVIKIKGEQFGQRIISDEKGGAELAWIDRRSDSTLADIYAQRISTNGKLLWDTTGIAVANNYNSLKSYLTIVQGSQGSCLAVFKNSRKVNNDIYAQKLFNTGTYVSQIVGFDALLNNDTVKVSWYSANEMGKTTYYIERTVQSDTSNGKWKLLRTINSEGNNSSKFYSINDKPFGSGTFYYRLIQKDKNGNSQVSEIKRVNYFSTSSSIAVAQNNPNPFIDATVISFYLPAAADVSIEIFDSHVEKIKNIEKEFPAGESSITFSGKGLKPGIYFYRFKSGDFVDVKKMVITN